jgi:GT2 family glycosyltransferase
MGFCAANNIGLKKVRTRYVALLNNDTVADPAWLFNLSKSLDDHPEAGFAASKMLFHDRPDRIDRAGDGYTTSATGFLRGRNRSADQYDAVEYIFGACAGAALYRTQMLRDVGLFDEDFFLVYEDVDLSFRAQLNGYKCIYVPNAIVYHKASGSIGQDSALSVYQSQRNLEWVYIKNIPKSLIPKTIIPHIIYNLAAFFYFTSIGKVKPYLKAKMDAIAKIDKPLCKRRIIQREKSVNDAYISSLLYNETLYHRLKSKFQIER